MSIETGLLNHFVCRVDCSGTVPGQAAGIVYRLNRIYCERSDNAII